MGETPMLRFPPAFRASIRRGAEVVTAVWAMTEQYWFLCNERKTKHGWPDRQQRQYPKPDVENHH
jgi:hypothetical protein